MFLTTTNSLPGGYRCTICRLRLGYTRPTLSDAGIAAIVPGGRGMRASRKTGGRAGSPDWYGNVRCRCRSVRENPGLR